MMSRWALVPGTVFLAGLVLPVWGVIADVPPGLPGIAAFPSAFLGDTVLIPAAVLLISLAVRRLDPASGERRLTAGVVTVGAAAAVVVQAQWLSDPHPRLNWTLPRPGHFTPAGWWHAAYFVGVSAVLLGLIALLLIRMRGERAKAAGLAEGPWAAVLIAAMAAYSGLALSDSAPGVPGGASVSSLVALAIAGLAVAGATVLSLGASAAKLWRPLLVGGAAAAALVSLIVGRHGLQTGVLPGVAATLITGTLIITLDLVVSHEPKKIRLSQRMVNGVATAVVCVAGWSIVSAEIEHLDLTGAFVAGGVFVAVLLALLYGILGPRVKEARWLVLTCIVTYVVIAGAVWVARDPSGLPTYGWLVANMPGLVLIGCTRFVQARVEYELGVQDENSSTAPRLPESRMGTATMALALIISFGSGVFFAVLALNLAASSGISLPTGGRIDHTDRMLAPVVVSFLVLAVVVAKARVLRDRRTWVRMAIRSSVPLVSIGLSLFLLAALVERPLKTLVIAEVVFAAIVGGIWTFESLASNIWYLQGAGFGRSDALLASSVAVLSASFVAWTLAAAPTSAFGGRAPTQGFILAAFGLLLMVVFTALLGAALVEGEQRNTELPVWRNLLQDGASISGIILIIVFPIIYSTTHLGIGAGLSLTIPLALLFIYPFTWIMRANRKWPGIEARRLLSAEQVARIRPSLDGGLWAQLGPDLRVQRSFRDAPVAGPNSVGFISALLAHTRHQNRIATVMLLGQIVTIVTVLAAYFVEDEGFHEFVNRTSRPSV